MIVSAPSGGGKTTLCSRLLRDFKNLKLSISCTTRAPRGQEKEGEAYFFLTFQEFESKVSDGDFAEWAKVHGNYYGTSKSTIASIFKKGHAVLLDIDVQGAHQLKKIYGDQAITIFLTPPSIEVLEQRLRGRGTDPEETILKRLAHAATEMNSATDFDTIVVNDQMEQAYEDLSRVVSDFLGKKAVQ